MSDLDDERISLRIRGTNGGDVFFKVKRNTPFKKVFDAFTRRHKLDPKQYQVRFLIDDKRLKENQTPEDFGLQGDEIINAMVYNFGG